IREEVRIEREAQLRELDAIDSKAGIVLGFAGALAALAPFHYRTIVDVGRAVSIASALLALAAFWPYRFPVLELEPLRAGYLGADPRFTGVHLLDTRIAILNETRELLNPKLRRLRAAVIALVAATLLVAGGGLV